MADDVQNTMKPIAPNDQDKFNQQIIQFRVDPDTGFYTLSCSTDNGLHYQVILTADGRKFSDKDAASFWPFLKKYVSSLIDGATIEWADIKGKPEVITKDQLEERLAKLAIPTDLVHSAELDQVRTDVSQAKQDAAQAVTVAKNAKAAIDTSDEFTVKKPSEYSEGFFHELKRVAVMIPDRSDLIESAQAGTIGILSTVSYGGYAHQTLKVLDSQRPMTFIRNGSVDTWYPWETVTTTITVD